MSERKQKKRKASLPPRMPRAKQVFGGVCLQSFMPPDPDNPKPAKVLFKAEDYEPKPEPVKKRKPRKRKDAPAEPRPIISKVEFDVPVSWN